MSVKITPRPLGFARALKIAPRCSGFGHLATREDHQMSCCEVACDLRYVDDDFDWNRVIIAYAERGESLSGTERAMLSHQTGHRL